MAHEIYFCLKIISLPIWKTIFDLRTSLIWFYVNLLPEKKESSTFWICVFDMNSIRPTCNSWCPWDVEGDERAVAQLIARVWNCLDGKEREVAVGGEVPLCPLLMGMLSIGGERLNGWEEPFRPHQWFSLNRESRGGDRKVEGQGSNCQHHPHSS